MRKGLNKSRNKKVKEETCYHRVIIPLYIPHQEDYYKESFKVFLYTLNSLRNHSYTKIKISVVSNGSHDAINDELHKLLKSQKIDDLFITKEKIGKINSVLKILRSSNESFVTITDADVFFLPGWDQAVFQIFKSFPRAGMVSPVPIFRTHLRHTANIWFKYFFSKRLVFRPVKNPEGLTKFAKSLGWRYLSEKLKDVILTLEAKDGTIAVVGNSHFVGTYNRQVFKNLPKGNSEYILGGDSERKYIDLPVVYSNGFKLATYDNYAYHLGNTIDKELNLDINRINSFDMIDIPLFLNGLNGLNESKWIYKLKEKLILKLFSYAFFKKIIFKIKGLNDEQIKNFLSDNYLDD